MEKYDAHKIKASENVFHISLKSRFNKTTIIVLH